MPWWNNFRWSGHPAFSGSSAPYVSPNPEYTDIYQWLGVIAAGENNPDYMCQACRYLGYTTCWDFYTITGISDASYYAHLATLNRNFQELEDSMAIFRQVRNWQHRHM